MLNFSVPLNFRTAIFCFLVGEVCSPAITAAAPAKWVSLLPTKYDHIPENVLVISYILLPLWSLIAVRKYKPLPRIGVTLFLALFVYGLLFPSLA